MGEQQDEVARLPTGDVHEQDAVAVAAAKILADAEIAVGALRAEAELAASEPALRETVRAMHLQLEQHSAAIVALETHSLRQTGGVALALSVLIAIAWKVIAG